MAAQFPGLLLSAPGGSRNLKPSPPPLLHAPRAAFHRGKLWAIARSSSLRGLLYLPSPEKPAPAARPRAAPTALRPIDRDRLSRGVARLGGRDVALDTTIDWSAPAHALLHSGDEVLALLRLAEHDGKPAPARLAAKLAMAWIEQNPFHTEPAWSLPNIARRLACWSTAIAAHSHAFSTPELEVLRKSIFLQARFLAANLEHHEGGARLLAQLRGLLGASSILTGAEPRSWLAAAARALTDAIRVQIHADGGHQTRDPATASRVLADLVDARALLPTESEAARLARERIPALAHFVTSTTHPDGAPAFLGNAGAHAAREGTPTEWGEPRRLIAPAFADTAMSVVAHPERDDKLVVDWLSREQSGPGAFELSLNAQRVVLAPAEPDHPRSSGVRIDGRPLLGSPRETKWGDGPGLAYLELDTTAAMSRVVRRLLYFESRCVVVVDRVAGAAERVESEIHLAAGFRVVERGERRLFCEGPEGTTVTLAWLPGMDVDTAATKVPDDEGEPAPSISIRFWTPGGGVRVLGFLLAQGRRRDAALDVVETAGGERIGLRFDPRRYLLQWDQSSVPRTLLAD